MIKNILVVCVGNVCRSPMAEALLRQALLDEDEVSVSSAGLGALVDFPAAGYAEDLMAERGLDISGHKARQLTPEIVDENDLILVMESAHKRAIEARDPAAHSKIFLLCASLYADIPDPFRKSKTHFEEVLQLIEQGVADWAAKIRAKQPEIHAGKEKSIGRPE